MKQQTAVDWLIDELRKPYSDEYIAKIIEQAKEMEREQIIEAYYAGTEQFDNAASIVRPKTPQDYYTQTYKP